MENPAAATLRSAVKQGYLCDAVITSTAETP